MKKNILAITCLLVFFDLVAKQHQCLLIFNDHVGEKLSDDAGMNVAHQVLTALIQQSCPILVTNHLWNHIITRGQRYGQNIQHKNEAYLQVKKLVEDVNKRIVHGACVDQLNKELNQDWYQKHYPMLAGLSDDAYKKVMFDYFCAQAESLIVPWSAYRVNKGYLLLVPSKDIHGFVLKDMRQIGQRECMQIYGASDVSLVATLAKLLQAQHVHWSLYMTGHGLHADKEHKQSLIAGIQLHEFQKLLWFLQEQITTNVLVYSSCYSSGLHLISPYQDKEGQDLKLSFPVIVTCLTDTPVYVMGVPSGLKLPAYGGNMQLEASDITPHGLNWYLLQDFCQFCACATQTKDIKNIAQAVMVYKDCVQQICSITKLENIALVRKPNTTFFVPVDIDYVDCILHNTSEIQHIHDKSGLLLYTKQYNGTIEISGRIPSIISMLPAVGVTYLSKVICKDFDPEIAMVQSFFSLDDMYDSQIFIIDDIQGKKNTFKQMMVLPKNSWMPVGIKSGSKGMIIFKKDMTWYVKQVNNAGVPGFSESLTKQQAQTVQKLWKLLYQQSQDQKGDNPEQLVTVQGVTQRRQDYQNLLRQCQKQKICCTLDMHDGYNKTL